MYPNDPTPTIVLAGLVYTVFVAWPLTHVLCEWISEGGIDHLDTQDVVVNHIRIVAIEGELV